MGGAPPRHTSPPPIGGGASVAVGQGTSSATPPHLATPHLIKVGQTVDEGGLYKTDRPVTSFAGMILSSNFRV